MLKKILLSGTTALVAASLSSCLDIDTQVLAQKDGSGTVTDTIFIEPQALEQIQTMIAMQQKDPAKAGEPTDALASLIKPENTAAAAKDLGEGVTVEKAEKIELNGKKGVRVIYKVPELAKLQLRPGNTLNYMMGAEKAAEAKQKMPHAKPITFTMQGNDLAIHLPQPPKTPAPAEAPQEVPEQQMDMMKKMFKGMRVNVALNVPSGIEKSNAANQSPTSVNLGSLEMDEVLKQPEALKKIISSAATSPADMTNALKGMPGVKFEPAETVNVTLK